MFNQLQEDLKKAMLSGNTEARDTLRLLISDIKKEVVDAGLDRENIPDDIAIKVLEKSIKSRKESIQIYEEKGRNDLADPERKQLEILTKYMPAQLSDEELKVIVDKVKTENLNIQGMALMGKIMPLVKGKAEPERIRKVL